MVAVAIIPARAGSRRIPGKNVKEFRGKPIIAYSIEAALKSKLFHEVYVSTDSMLIAEVATQYGAKVRNRPAHLADDHTGTQAVMAHELSELLTSQELAVETACCIYPTAPFILPEDLFRGASALISGKQYAFSVTTYDFPIQRAMMLGWRNEVSPKHPEHNDTRSQDLPVYHHDAGQWYWGRTFAFLSNTVLYDIHSVGVPIPRWRVQDIDTMEDFTRAELMHQSLFGKNHG